MLFDLNFSILQNLKIMFAKIVENGSGIIYGFYLTILKNLVYKNC